MIHKRTKIVCTLGPASDTEPLITDMVKSGMNVARLNFSHGTHAEHAVVIERIRTVEKKLGTPIGIMQDLQGPKIRVGIVPIEGVRLESGSMIVSALCFIASDLRLFFRWSITWIMELGP